MFWHENQSTFGISFQVVMLTKSWTSVPWDFTVAKILNLNNRMFIELATISISKNPSAKIVHRFGHKLCPKTGNAHPLHAFLAAGSFAFSLKSLQGNRSVWYCQQGCPFPRSFQCFVFIFDRLRECPDFFASFGFVCFLPFGSWSTKIPLKYFGSECGRARRASAGFDYVEEITEKASFNLKRFCLSSSAVLHAKTSRKMC